MMKHFHSFASSPPSAFKRFSSRFPFREENFIWTIKIKVCKSSTLSSSSILKVEFFLLVFVHRTNPLPIQSPQSFLFCWNGKIRTQHQRQTFPTVRSLTVFCIVKKIVFILCAKASARWRRKTNRMCSPRRRRNFLKCLQTKLTSPRIYASSPPKKKIWGDPRIWRRSLLTGCVWIWHEWSQAQRITK